MIADEPIYSITSKITTTHGFILLIGLGWIYGEPSRRPSAHHGESHVSTPYNVTGVKPLLWAMFPFNTRRCTRKITTETGRTRRR